MLQRGDTPDALLERLRAWQPTIKAKWSEREPS